MLEMAKGQYKKWLENDNLILLQGWKRNGLTDEQIAKNIGISARTLERWKKQYGQICRALKVGREQANFAVEGKLLQKAMSGNIGEINIMTVSFHQKSGNLPLLVWRNSKLIPVSVMLVQRLLKITAKIWNYYSIRC